MRLRLALSRGYKALSKDEKQQVKEKLTMLEVLINSLRDEIKSPRDKH
jgi:hypothetical protein